MINFFAALITIPIFFAWFFAVGLYNSWALSWLWFWFAVPLGAPELSVPHVWGLLLISAAVRNKLEPMKTKGEQKEFDTVNAVSHMLLPIIALGVGYILKGFL